MPQFQETIAPDRLRVGTNIPNSDSVRVRVAGNTTDQTTVSVELYGNGTPGGLFRGVKARGSAAAPADAQNGDAMLTIMGYARSTTIIDTGYITMEVADVVVPTQRPASRIIFATNANNALPALRMYISRDGMVGVGAFVPGTTEAAEKLHVMTAGTNALAWGLQLANPNNTNNNATAIGICFSADSNTALAKGGIAYYRDTTDWGRGRMLIMQNSVANATKPTATDVVVQIENNGFIGVGKVWTSTIIPLGLTHLSSNDLAEAYIQRSSADASPPQRIFRKSRGTVAAPGNVVNSDSVGEIHFHAYTASWFETSSIRCMVDGATTSSQRPPTRLEFWTNLNNAAATLAMTIDDNNRVGIGDVSPDRLLHVNGTNSDAAIKGERCSTDANGFDRQFYKSRGTDSSKSNVAQNDEIGRVSYYGYVGSSFENAYIRVFVDDTITAAQAPAMSIQFATGAKNATATVKLTINKDGNFGFNSTSYGASSVGVLAIGNATTVPTGNPTGGGVLYSEAGAGKWRGSGGTITTFGPADPHCPECGSDFGVEYERHPDIEADAEKRYLAICFQCLINFMNQVSPAAKPWVRKVKPPEAAKVEE